MRFAFALLMLTTANIARASSCVEIADSADRLDCFDMARNCTRFQSGAARLDCFDKAYLRPQVSDPVAEEIKPGRVEQIAEPAQVEQVLESDAGEVREQVVGSQVEALTVRSKAAAGFGKKKRSSAPAEYIEAKIVKVVKNSRRIDFLRLENGQTWRENEDYGVRFKVGQTVRIEEGILGSFNLRLEGINKLVKVRRID